MYSVDMCVLCKTSVVSWPQGLMLPCSAVSMVASWCCHECGVLSGVPQSRVGYQRQSIITCLGHHLWRVWGNHVPAAATEGITLSHSWLVCLCAQEHGRTSLGDLWEQPDGAAWCPKTRMGNTPEGTMHFKGAGGAWCTWKTQQQCSKSQVRHTTPQFNWCACPHWLLL